MDPVHDYNMNQMRTIIFPNPKPQYFPNPIAPHYIFLVIEEKLSGREVETLNSFSRLRSFCQVWHFISFTNRRLVMPCCWLTVSMKSDRTPRPSETPFWILIASGKLSNLLLLVLLNPLSMPLSNAVPFLKVCSVHSPFPPKGKSVFFYSALLRFFSRVFCVVRVF